MFDRRLTPANTHVAAAHLRGLVDAPRYCIGTEAVVCVPYVDLLDRPGGRRDRQLLQGCPVKVYERRDGIAFVQETLAGYVGYVPETALSRGVMTHKITARMSHIYAEPSFKSPDVCALSFGARIEVIGVHDKMAETPQGFIPMQHLAPLADLMSDPADVAQLFLGAPYLWGGNTMAGIDCSGLVQASLLACGIDCPGDSDLIRSIGAPVSGDIRRNDLLFWRGHVALVLDSDTIIHANAHHMAVTIEPFIKVNERVIHAGDGPLAACRRLL